MKFRKSGGEVKTKETTLDDVVEKLNEHKKVLKEISRWLRFQNIEKLRDLLTTELDTDEKKLAFENTNGVRGIDEIAAISGAPRDTIYGWWKKWYRLGFLGKSELRKGRLRAICSLEDLGIKVPKAQGIKKEIEKQVKNEKEEKP